MVHRTPTRTQPEDPRPAVGRQRRRQGAFIPGAAQRAAPVSPGSAPTPCRAPGATEWFPAGAESTRAHSVAEQADVVPRDVWCASGSEVAPGRRPRVGVTGRLRPVHRALQRSRQSGSQTCIGDAVTLTSGGGGVSC